MAAMTRNQRLNCMAAILLMTTASILAGSEPLVTNSVGMRLAPIPRGQFAMGSPATEAGRFADEVRHPVRLTSGFLIGVTEVTQREWKAVMGDFHPSRVKGDDLPVMGVKWADAVQFCKKLSEKEGKRYRLPTEAEWEWACRAGAEAPFAGGAADEVAWHTGNSGETPHPVARRKPNAWGLYDMHGNAMEWCSDAYQERLGRDLVTDPKGPAEDTARVLRGGSFLHRMRAARCAARHSLMPSYQLQHVGFRVVMEKPDGGQQ